MENFEKVIEEYKKRTEKECYEFEVLEDEIPDIMDNKIGGIPYIPKGTEYPLDRNGNPMSLLLQVNLSEIQLENFPSNGILEVFTSKDFGYPLEYKVLYFKKIKEARNDLEDLEIYDSITDKPLKIKLKKAICHMPIQDYRADVLIPILVRNICDTSISGVYDLSEECLDKLCRLLYIPKASIGGYPDFTQYDPRSENDKEDKDECVFKIDSMLNKSLFIGDCGIIWGLISKTDLLNKKFRKTDVDWDCC